MKKISFVLIIAVVMISCSQNQSASEGKKDSVEAKKMDTTTYPYKATYSSNFDFGTPASVKTVLDIWKSYETNTFDATRNLWADSVTLQFEDFTFHGNVDSTIAGGKRDRGQYTSVIDSVDAWVPLHSNDRNEDWVAVWGREYTVNKKGKKDTADLHEIWLLKNGKASFMSQYRAHRMH